MTSIPQQGDYPEEGYNSETHSETPTERYERKKQLADSVWFSGFFSGYTYLPRPKKIDESGLDMAAQEELMEEETYVVPRGYKYYAHELPEIIMPVPVGKIRTALIVYTVLTAIAFVFLLVASCPVAWYRGKDETINGVNYDKVEFGIWRQKGGNLPDLSVRDMHDCPIEKQFLQTIAASNTMACIFAFLSIIPAVKRLTVGGGSYGWIVMIGFLAFGWGICGNAMSIKLFYTARCAKPQFSDISNLDAGFALSLLGWIFQLVAVVVLGFATHMNVGPAIRGIRIMDTLFLVLLLVALLFCVVANVGTVWKRRFNTADVTVVRVTYWHTELIKGDGVPIYYGRAHYRCPAYTKRMKASISFLILGSIALFFASIFSIGAFLKRGLRIASCVMTIFASIFLFISWVIAVAVFYRTCCKESSESTMYANYPGVPTGVLEGMTKFTGYGVQEGVVLVIVAWILCTGGVILNFISPWPVKKSSY